MSWIEEQSWFGLEDLIFEDKQEQLKIKRKFLTKKIWTTKDGTEIPISKMSITHIKNCINKGNKGWRTWALPHLKRELNGRI